MISASVAEHFRRSQELAALVAGDPAFLAAVGAIAERVIAALEAGHKLLLAGNGGSAADAQHIAAELLSRFRRERAPLAAVALTTDTSALTAIGNDFGFEHVFARQLRGLGHKGDVFLAISTSGRSANVLRALEAARELGLVCIGFTGARAGPMQSLCDLLLAVPSEETALIQQIHLVAAHAICGAVEAALCPDAPR